MYSTARIVYQQLTLKKDHIQRSHSYLSFVKAQHSQFPRPYVIVRNLAWSSAIPVDQVTI